MKVSIYSSGTLEKVKNEYNKEIKQAITGNAELKKIIQKDLKKANERIRAIKNRDLASPSVKKILAERSASGRKYSVFNISGLDLSNERDWEKAQLEYSRALSFLNNPTSTITGTKEYIKHIADNYDLPFDVANSLVDKATQPDITEHSLNIKGSNEILSEIDDIYSDVERAMFESDEDYYKSLTDVIDTGISNVRNAVNDIIQDFDSMIDDISPRLR